MINLCRAILYGVICSSVWIGRKGLIQATSFPEDEYAALYDLFNATNGMHWRWRNTSIEGPQWEFQQSTDPCTANWQGLNCTLDTFTDTYHIQEIRLVDYNLTGTIPHSLDSFQELTVLDLGANHLRGVIPDRLSELTQLEVLRLELNEIRGTIPAIFTYMTELEHIDLSNNTLLGTIPAGIWALPNLRVLSLHHNLMLGPLSDAMGDAVNLQYVVLNTNRFSGQLPSNLGNLLQLQHFDVQQNDMSGPIPPSIGNLTKLQLLDLDFNYLTGCIPSSIGNLTSLQKLELYYNDLSCTVPASIAQLGSLLTKLSAGENQLTGMVPDIFHNFPLLQDLSFGTNHLSGAPATFLGQLPSLLFLYLDNNHFTGTLPTTVTDNNHLHDLVMYGNYLTGTIAVAVGNMVNITDLDLSENFLTGTVPELRKLVALEGCLLRYNHLSGSVDSMFDPVVQTRLNTLQINNNQFTGTIPPEFFALRRLNTLVAGNNCFRGTLPSNICDGTAMLSLILDGMSAATACRRDIMSGVLKSYLTTHSVDGTVPACLFQLPNLTTLHLSGNGFYGTLPHIENFGTALVDVALSYNALTGSIPSAIQDRKWYSFDLSFNLLGGTLSEDIHSEPIVQLPEHVNRTLSFLKPSFSLENNFLSGRIPVQLRDLQSISILGTNLYNCDYLGSQLPHNDGNRSTYQCGSTAFDIPYYILISLCGSAIVAAVVVMRWKSAHSWYTAALRSMQEVILYIQQCNGKLNRLDSLCKVAASCTVFALVVLLPLYAAFQVHYGVMSYQYAWSVSAAFLSSSTATGVLIVMWLVLLALFLCAVEQYGICRSSQHDCGDRLQVLTLSGFSNYEGSAVFAWYTAVNVVVVVSVNVVYVYVAIYQSSTVLFLVRILMSIFKLFWNNVCAAYLLDYICEWVKVGSSKQADRLVLLQLTIALVNTVVIPCLVVAGISSDCFYNVFVAAPAVSSQYASQVCQVGNVESQCLEYLAYPGTTTFSPPFTYKYQCSSSLVTYYAPPFVYLCIFSIFVVPMALQIAIKLRARATKGTYWYFVIDYCIPTIMNPLSTDTDQEHIKEHTSFFKSPHAVITLTTLLGLVLTFGAVFPPLAAAFTATMVAAVLFCKYDVGKFRSTAVEFNLSRCVEVIERDCLDLEIVPVHESAVWMLVTLTCWFYSLFLFDTLGSAVGFDGAYWVLIVMPLMPLVLYGLHQALKQVLSGGAQQANSLAQRRLTAANTSNAEPQSIELSVAVMANELIDKETETLNVIHDSA